MKNHVEGDAADASRSPRDDAGTRATVSPGIVCAYVAAPSSPPPSATIRRVKNIHRVAFFGTHELAAPALDVLTELGLKPEIIVTRPEAGLAEPEEEIRLPARATPQTHPVRDWAEEHGVRRVTSRRGKEERVQKPIAELKPDLIVDADYGRPVPPELLAHAARGGLGLHASKLPKYRGEHAIRAALSEGAKKTGVTVYRIDEEPWAGPILLQEEIEIGDTETYGELLPRMVEIGTELFRQGLQKVDRAKNPATRKQNERSATNTQRMDRRHCKAPWSMDADGVYNRLRAHSPSGLLAFFKYRPIRIVSGKPLGWEKGPDGVTGTYLGMRQGRLAILCGNATVFGIDRLYRPGDDPMSASDFAYKEELSVGDRFV
ncbi:MAG: formyltransferase family protein [Acidobacteriota bacterium]